MRSVILSLLCGALILGAAAGAVYLLSQQPEAKTAAPPPRPPALVMVSEIQKKEVTPRQSIVGTIMAVRVSNVGSAASGRVAEFLVNEGDWVRAKQPIARLQTATIEAELEAAKATLQAQEADLDRLHKSIDDEILQAEARVEKSLAMKDYLLAKKNRILALITQGASSKEELDETMALARQAQATRQEDEVSLKMMKNTKAAKLANARAKRNAAAAEVDHLREQLERHTFKAPFDGYVVAEHTEAGEWVLQGALVATIAELDHVEIEVPVLEDYVSYFQVGDEVPVEVPALPAGQNTFTGKVVLIVPKANTKARTFPVKVRIKNQPVRSGSQALLLKSGMLARVVLPTGPTRQALLAPRGALKLEGDRRSLYVVEPDSQDAKFGLAREITVQLGLSQGDYVEVLGENLREGQLIVTRGQERLFPVQQVQMAPSDTK